MTLRNLFLTAIAAVAVSAAAASAAPNNDPHHNVKGPMGGAMSGAMHGPMGPMHIDKDRQWKDNRGTLHNDHDRYWRPEYHSTVSQDRIFAALRGHGYARFNGAPYWYQGRYVVKSFDRLGRPIFVEINPYTGAFVGVVRF